MESADESTRQLRALAHPLRIQLLMELREGSATSAMLARRTGQTRGNISYHLRTLAAAGVIRESPDRGTGRERWWQATALPEVAAHTLVGDRDTAEATKALTVERGRRLADFGARLGAGEVPPDRVAATRVSELRLRLSATQQAALVAELDAVLARWEHTETEAVDDGEVVEVQLAVFSGPDGE